MNKTIVKGLTIAVLSIAINGCSSVYEKHVQWQMVKPESFPVLYAIGYAPISLQKSTHETQRMLMAIKASKIAAYAELAEQVYGQQINGKTTVANLLLENQTLAASVQGVIRGAKVIKSYPVGDSYTTELSLDFKDVYDIYLSMARKREIKDVQYF
ncbi:MAG: LPP20 family lipoprotein [Alteromonadaceae bacterium]|nr:LPP20 family lipoprotein [Alteromonadaceae bacterium]